MPQRITTIITSLALIGAIFAGVPSSVRAAAAEIYVGIAGADYTTAVAGCRDLDITILAGSEVDVAEDIADASVDADTGGTIYLCPGTYHFFTPAEMQKNDITLKGAGATQTILDGGNDSRIVVTEGNLLIESLTMQNAYAGVSDSEEGGAVLAGGTVDVTSVTFKHNFADKGGGAIAAFDNVTVESSIFISNTTADQGGAIASHETVSVTFSTFTSNSSIADNLCIGGGGAIAAAHDVFVSDSTFTGNSAVLGDDTNLALCGTAGSFGGFGGAIATLGYEQVSRSSFRSNKAALVGGAIFSANSAPTRAAATITDSTFSGNSLLPLEGEWNLGMTYGQVGSGVAAFSDSPLVILSSTFSGNGALLSPNDNGGLVACGTVFGQVVEVGSSSFTGNKSASGSGVCAFQSLIVDSSTFVRNDATSFGGAIYGRGLLEVTSSTFTKNRASFGGAIAIDFGAVASIERSIFKQNSTRVLRQIDAGRTQFLGLGGAVISWGTTTLTSNLFTRNGAQRAGGAVYFLTSAAEAFGLMSGNRFTGNAGAKAGGAVGYNLFDTASLPTRSQLRAAQRANRFSGNTASRGPLIGGLKVQIVFPE